MHIDLHVSIPSKVALIIANRTSTNVLSCTNHQDSKDFTQVQNWSCSWLTVMMTERHLTIRFDIDPMNVNCNNSRFDSSAAICNADNLLKNIIHLTSL